MKRWIFVVLLAIMPMVAPAPAQADDSVTLSCTEIFSPTDVPVMAAGGWRIGDHTGLVNAKAHPLKADVYFVQCKGTDMPKGSKRYIQACKIIADSFGQWTENGTGRGGQRFVWQTWNCADVLNRI